MICKIPHQELIGKKFGRLTPLSFFLWTKYIKYNCICDCGNSTVVFKQSLTKGTSNSCGCLQKEAAGKPKIGLSKLIKPNAESAKNTVFSYYIRNAKKRNHEFSLTKEEFLKLTSSNCEYCKIEPLQEFKPGNRKKSESYYYNGVDRVNNKIGYILSNCVSCCFICNRAKGGMTLDEFYSWIERVYGYIKKR